MKELQKVYKYYIPFPFKLILGIFISKIRKRTVSIVEIFSIIYSNMNFYIGKIH